MENNSESTDLTTVNEGNLLKPDDNPLKEVPDDCTNVSFVGGCIQEPEQCNFLWRTSWCTLPTAICAYYNNYYFSSALCICILLTSLNYWRKPVYGFSRNLDMFTTFTSVGLHLIKGINSEYALIHYPLVFIGLSCYPIGVYYYNKKQYWLSTYFHGSLHFISNVAYFILFCGKIEPFRYLTYLN